jgi:hypothetical protein
MNPTKTGVIYGFDYHFGIFKLFLHLPEHLSLTPVFVRFMVLDR